MDRTLERLCGLQPDYVDHGATLGEHSPPGFEHDRYERDLGHGAEVFERAKHGLSSWRAHDVAGIHVFLVDAEVEVGGTVVVALGVGIAIAAPCRIVAVIDKPRRWGFAYGSLPGHPEQGEEAFIVSWLDNDVVRFGIHAFSRPSDRLVRWASPLSRRIQIRATQGYLDSLQRYVDSGASA
jgi:uncharacterized protein (UPF0548 family)